MKDNLIHSLIQYMLVHPSYLFQKIEIQFLYHLTAKAFNKPSKWIVMKKNQEMLECYALFTKENLQEEQIDQKRLYHIAYKTGKTIRRCLFTNNSLILSDCVRLLYQNIEIKILGNLPGEIIIPQCFFNQYYREKECICISAMDRGLIEGMIPGGKFYFMQRKTKGCHECIARKE